MTGSIEGGACDILGMPFFKPPIFRLTEVLLSHLDSRFRGNDSIDNFDLLDRVLDFTKLKKHLYWCCTVYHLGCANLTGAVGSSYDA